MENNNNNNQEPGKKKKNKVYIPLMIVVLVVLAGVIYWYHEYSRYITTDDANIDADRVAVSSKIPGRISKLYVQEGDSVQKGMLLAEIDSAELIAQKKLDLAAKNQAIASEKQDEATYLYNQEDIKVQEINFQKAKDDMSRAKTQHEGGVMTQEQFEHTQNAFESAKAQLEKANKQLAISRAKIASSQASIENANAKIGLTTTQLKNTQLYAPFDGVVAKRFLLPGDITQAGQSIFTLTNDRKLWVIVYLEETNLSQIYLNQPAIFKVDAFSGITFSGKIFFIGSNTASQFSLIPPSNASGNFTKITQRVPVKISIDKIKNNKFRVKTVKLLSGMSAVVKIIK